MNINTTAITPTRVFTFSLAPGHSIDLRTVALADGSPGFVAADICASLGIKNTVQALARVDDEDKHILNIGMPGRAPFVVTESGLYTLVLTSRLKAAKVFKRWVTSEVLPSIRKHGVYVQGQEATIPEGLNLQQLEALDELLKARMGTARAHLDTVQASQALQISEARLRYLENRRDREEALEGLKNVNRICSGTTSAPHRSPKAPRKAHPKVIV